MKGVSLNKVVKGEGKVSLRVELREKIKGRRKGREGEKKERNCTGDARGRAHICGSAIIIYHL